MKNALFKRVNGPAIASYYHTLPVPSMPLTIDARGSFTDGCVRVSTQLW